MISSLKSISMKRKGSLYEQKYFATALEAGLEVFTPLGDYLPQDCMVMNSAGRIFKVQIKGTQGKSKDPRRKGTGRYQVTTSSGCGSKFTIDCANVDIVVAYIDELNIFYHIPCIEIGGVKRISLYPHITNSRAKLERFKNNWDCYKIS